MIKNKDSEFIRAALLEAEKALATEDVPVGCVLELGGKIIASARNRVEELGDPTAHAEILAIRSACATVGEKRLPGATIYVTLEPCPMCAGAIVLAGISRIVFGASDPKAGACGTLYEIPNDARLNRRCEIVSGVEEQACARILRDFFEKLRCDK